MKTAFSILIAQLLLGCHGESVATLARNPAPEGALSVVSENGTQYSGTLARINVRFPEPTLPDVEIDIASRDTKDHEWTMFGRLMPTFLSTGDASLELRAGQLEKGFGTVQLRYPPQMPTFAERGVIELAATGNTIRGTVRGATSDLNAHFEGPLAIVCSVPMAALPSAGPTAPVPVPQDGASAPVLVVDQRMESDLCRPLVAGIQRDTSQSVAHAP